jgi:predicted lactoylglutathione lyase
MSKKIFVNLPVKDLDRSVEFFTKLGYSFNPQFTDQNATCMIISDTINAMLLVEPFFKTFTLTEIADTQRTNECAICISADEKAEVDSIVALAKDAGATIPRDKQDYGFMYSHGFKDLDGHLWEYMWMDPAGPPQQ